ncbi:T9SS type A sorting domain-containing protein [Salisaeta longa]|uniref:T9SS type A sorting domain-containing protein n=1 Tax=Salisaeta longa TaxID=503170 RepID=UPI00146CEBED|nr:T9SS type A sorting domain-containing protein [Salisaeta longa]
MDDGTGGIVDADGGSTTYLDDTGNSASFANSTNLEANPQFIDAANPAGPDGVAATRDDGTAQVDIGAYELQSRVVAVTGGGFGGLDRTFSATPGQADQPMGLFRLTSSQSGVDLTKVAVTPDAPGATGVDGASLWVSDDDQFDAAADTKLASLDLTPQTDLPSPLTFDGFSAGLPAAARYLFVTVTFTSGAEGTVTGYLADETALALSGGVINAVNGNAGQAQFSNLPLSGDATPLPVELVRLEAARTGGGVRLRWQTATETGNAVFAVQRQTGATTWQRVGFVAGAGTTAEAQTYRFTDTELPYAADSLAYRLKQIDTDGSASFSEAITVVREAVRQLELLGTYPNPARQQATVRFAVPARTADETVRLRLYDVLGRQVRTVRAAAGPGRHELTLDVQDLASGVYFLRLQAGGQVQTQKLTVVR